MSDYSYSHPCCHLRLSSSVAEELRTVCESVERSDDYIIQIRSHLSKDKSVPFELLKTFWKNHKGTNSQSGASIEQAANGQPMVSHRETEKSKLLHT